MDIRRIPLWQSRNATYMSNNLVRAVIEDQGEVAIELSARSVQGGFVNALSLPYRPEAATSPSRRRTRMAS